MKLWKSALTLSMLVLLSACTTAPHYDAGDTVGGPQKHHRVDREQGDSGTDPLLDAPHRALITCESEKLVSVLQRFKEVPFACKKIGVSATIDEMRDAGWRLLSLDIGQETEQDNHVGFPVTITMRKLF